MNLDIALRPFAILSAKITVLARDLIALLPNLAAAVLILILTFFISWLVGALVHRSMARSRARAALIDAMRRLARIAIWIVGVLVAATLAFPHLTATKALAGLGIGSLAIGLAFRDIFENFLAGFFILLRKPMRIGDDIECEGVSGRVERITIRDTFVRKRSGELVLVPNSFLYKNPLEILTDLDLRRLTVEVGVAYGENVDQARAVIRHAVEGLQTVAPTRAVDVFAHEFADSAIAFTVRWWTKSTPPDALRSRDEVVGAIKAALDAAGIEIPFPYRTLVVKPPLPPVPVVVPPPAAPSRGGPARG